MNSFFVLACLASLAFANAIEINIGCKFPGVFDETCSGKLKIYNLNEEKVLRNMILDKHNEIRDTMARSDLNEGQPLPAAKMLTMVWNDGLAKMAERTARKCATVLGRCDEADFIYTRGQNICVQKFQTGDDIKPEDIIQKCYEEWEHSAEKTDDIKALLASFPEPTNSVEHPSAPFARMILDRNCIVGCSLSSFELKKDENSKEAADFDFVFVFVCKYLLDVESGTPVYEPDVGAGTKCSQRSKRFPNICDISDTKAYLGF